MILPPVEQSILQLGRGTAVTDGSVLPTPQQALSRAIQQMRYLQDPANSPEIQRRNRRRMRLCLPPLEEYYPMQHRHALRAVELQQGNECPSHTNSQT